MSRPFAALLFAAMAFTGLRAQDRLVPIIPLMGDTLDTDERHYLGLFKEVAGFRWAVFLVNRDSMVTAKVFVRRGGDRGEFMTIPMGSLSSLRRKLERALARDQKNVKPWKNSFFAALSFARSPVIDEPEIKGREISARLDLGYNIGTWGALSLSLDSYDPAGNSAVSFVVTIFSPQKYYGLIPYLYYNPRPFHTPLETRKIFRQSLGCGIMKPLKNSQVMFRGGVAVLFTSITGTRWINDSQTGYPVAWVETRTNKVFLIAEISAEFYLNDF